ncbi:hypothetical protein BC962_1782 [Gillisia mitskevichiae]|uniref:Uncharacterized protein n=1 Tax=Gillisia mitskevichiae TaxID=270921 RepID=A0A495PUT2_9FLAO|nr:hypothetical protein [Gillisia mitskevichiae]RKS53530.1 hypothetical protein BC962_1782 [Gillisia mitskevichiae]
MNSHFVLSDAQYEKQFATAQLDPALFSHEAHLRLAYIHISNYGIEQAISNITFQLKKYVQNLGAEDKFNMTLSVAAIKAMDHFIKRSSSTNFLSLITEFPRLKYNFKDLMAAHYAIEIYNIPLAKQQFLEPDLLPFN